MLDVGWRLKPGEPIVRWTYHLKFSFRSDEEPVFKTRLVEHEVIRSSPLLCNRVILKGQGDSEKNPLDVTDLAECTPAYLDKIRDYYVFHLTPGRSDKERKLFDGGFLRKCEPSFLFGLMSLAHAWGLAHLVELISKAVANLMKEKTPEQTREMFGLKDDLTEEEKLAPIEGTNDLRIRLLNVLNGRKLEALKKRKPEAAALEGAEQAPQVQVQVQDTRSVEELAAEIEGLGEKSSAGKAKASKKRNRKKALADGDPGVIQDPAAPSSMESPPVLNSAHSPRHSHKAPGEDEKAAALMSGQMARGAPAQDSHRAARLVAEIKDSKRRASRTVKGRKDKGVVPSYPTPVRFPRDALPPSAVDDLSRRASMSPEPLSNSDISAPGTPPHMDRTWHPCGDGENPGPENMENMDNMDSNDNEEWEAEDEPYAPVLSPRELTVRDALTAMLMPLCPKHLTPEEKAAWVKLIVDDLMWRQPKSLKNFKATRPAVSGQCRPCADTPDDEHPPDVKGDDDADSCSDEEASTGDEADVSPSRDPSPEGEAFEEDYDPATSEDSDGHEGDGCGGGPWSYAECGEQEQISSSSAASRPDLASVAECDGRERNSSSAATSSPLASVSECDGRERNSSSAATSSPPASISECDGRERTSSSSATSCPDLAAVSECDGGERNSSSSATSSPPASISECDGRERNSSSAATFCPDVAAVLECDLRERHSSSSATSRPDLAAIPECDGGERNSSSSAISCPDVASVVECDGREHISSSSATSCPDIAAVSRCDEGERNSSSSATSCPDLAPASQEETTAHGHGHEMAQECDCIQDCSPSPLPVPVKHLGPELRAEHVGHIQQLLNQFLREAGLSGHLQVVPVDPRTATGTTCDPVTGNGGDALGDGQHVSLESTLARLHSLLSDE